MSGRYLYPIAEQIANKAKVIAPIHREWNRKKMEKKPPAMVENIASGRHAVFMMSYLSTRD